MSHLFKKSNTNQILKNTPKIKITTLLKKIKKIKNITKIQEGLKKVILFQNKIIKYL